MDQQIQQSIYEAIDVVVEKKNSKLQFDRTIDCVITEVVNLTTGEYKVRYLDSIFSAFDLNNKNFKVGKLVQVLVPQNDMSQRKTILGAKDSKTTSTTDIILDNERVNLVGIPFNEIYSDKQANYLIQTEGNIYGSNQQEANKPFKSIFYPTDENGNKILPSNINCSAFKSYAKDQTHFLLSGEFLTNWARQIDNLTLDEPYQGVYGLEIIFKTTEGTFISYQMNLKDLFGDYLKYNMDYVPFNQLFEISGSDLESIEDIRLYSHSIKRKTDGKDLTDAQAQTTEQTLKSNWENNHIGEIFVRNISCQFAKLIDHSGYSLNLKPLRGIYQELSTQPLLVEAELKYNGAANNIDASAITYYWFERDVRVNLGSDLYNSIGGIGWKVVNQTGKQLEVYLNEEKDTSLISKTYKCVAVYAGIQLSNIITLYRTYSVQTEGNVYGEIIQQPQVDGTSDLIVKLYNIDASKTLTYTWFYEDPSGNIFTINDTGSILKNVITNNIISYRNYYCIVTAVTPSTEENGKDKHEDIITLMITLDNKPEEQEYEVIFKPSKEVFLYNTYGDLYADSLYSEPVISHSLGFEIKQNIGEYAFKWIFPNLNNSMIKEIVENENLEGTSSELSDRNITFKIRDRFDYSKTDNQIELQISRGNGEVQSHYFNLTFTKEGNSGTNGTSLFMRIGYAPGSHKALHAGNFVQFQADIFYNGKKVTEDFSFSASIPKDYREYNPLIKDYITTSGNIVTITVPSDIAWGNNFNAVIQIKASPNNKNVFTYNLLGLQGVPFTIDDGAIDLLPEGTFQVVYDSDGHSPSYPQTPFKLDNWSTIEVLGNGGLLLEEDNSLEPYEKYYGRDTYGAIKFLKDSSNELYYIHPIVFMTNAFSKELLNVWDGVSVQIDEEKGSILAPQIGAGLKDAQNKFTGVLMGQYIGDDASLSNKHGLYGFSGGVATFAFKDDGTAFIGAPNGGRIEFDGTKGIIQSGNFQSNASGMKIDLDDGSIEAHNFKLDSSALTVDSINNKFNFTIGSKDTGYFKVQGVDSNDDKKTLLNISNAENGGYYLQSINYSPNSSGMKIDLKDGSIDAKNFKIDSNGKATFSGDLDAAGGTFSGDLSAAGGTFSGTLSAASGSFKGTLSGADITGATGTFSGKLSVKEGSIGGWTINEGSLESGDALISSTQTVNVKGTYGSEGTLTVTAPFIQFDNNYIWSDSNKLRLVSDGTSSGISMVAEYGNIFISCGSDGEVTLRTVGGSLGERIIIQNGASSSSLLDLIQSEGGGSGGTAVAVFG